MTWDEYNKLFHELQLNRVAFKRLMDSDEEVLKLVNTAIAAEREACAELCEQMDHDGVMIAADCAEAIRARGNT